MGTPIPSWLQDLLATAAALYQGGTRYDTQGSASRVGFRVDGHEYRFDTRSATEIPADQVACWLVASEPIFLSLVQGVVSPQQALCDGSLRVIGDPASLCVVSLLFERTSLL